MIDIEIYAWLVVEIDLLEFIYNSFKNEIILFLLSIKQNSLSIYFANYQIVVVLVNVCNHRCR